MIIRYKYLKQIKGQLKIHKVCALLGPRQCGKTTLSRQFAEENNIPQSNIFDLENYVHLERLKDPLLTLSDLQGIIIIDEIHLLPNIFSTIRVLVDNYNLKFLILGSASRDLIKQNPETLAGRIGYIEITPFKLADIYSLEQMWLRGGFPLSYLQDTDDESYIWRQNYIKTFLERDIPNLGFTIPPVQLRRFWNMICNYHGGIFNASELGNSLGISHNTAKRYLDILEGTFMIRVLKPWYENIAKRQVKTPKIYFRDSGIYHGLLGFIDRNSLDNNPKVGASWEGFAIEEVINYYNADQEECYFWSSHSNAEIDLLIFKNGKRLGFEFKYSSVPKITKSIKIAIEDLKLDEVFIVYPGKEEFKMSEKVRAIGFNSLYEKIRRESYNIEYHADFAPEALLNTSTKINDLKEIETLVQYFSNTEILLDDKEYIYECLNDFKRGINVYKTKRILNVNNWKLNCTQISHEPNAAFFRGFFVEITNSFLEVLKKLEDFKREKNINDLDINNGMAIIFLQKRGLNSYGINMIIELTLKNGTLYSKEYSFGLNVTSSL